MVVCLVLLRCCICVILYRAVYYVLKRVLSWCELQSRWCIIRCVTRCALLYTIYDILHYTSLMCIVLYWIALYNNTPCAGALQYDNIIQLILCYTMLCYAMVSLWYVMLCYAMSGDVLCCDAVFCFNIWSFNTSRYFTMRCSTRQYITMPGITIQYRVFQLVAPHCISILHCRTSLSITLHHHTEQHIALQCITVRRNNIWSTMSYCILCGVTLVRAVAFLLWCVMWCYVIPYHAGRCYGMSCHVMSLYDMTCHATLTFDIIRVGMACDDMVWYDVCWHLILYFARRYVAIVCLQHSIW